MKILVTGATGFLGAQTALSLSAQGHQILATGRCLSKAPKGPSIDFIAADLTQELPAVLFEHTKAVVHCAALSSPWGRYEDFYKANVLATRQLIDLSLKHAVKRFIHISSPSIYFDFKDKQHIKETDTLPLKKANYYAETKYLAELEVLAGAQKGLPCLMLRPRAIFGPGDRALLPRIIKANQTKFIPHMRSDGGPLCDLTHVDNVVHAINLALHAQTPCRGQAYNISNAEPVYLQNLLKNLIAALGLRYNARTIPYALARGYAAGLEWVYRHILKGQEPAFTQYSISLLYYNQTLDISKAQTELGYAPVISMKEAIDQVVRAWKKHYD